MHPITLRLSAFADESDNRLEGQIAALHRNQLSLLEIRNLNGRNVTDLTDAEVRDAAALLRAEGIRVWSIGSPLGKVDIGVDPAQYLDKVRRTCDIAAGFGCDKIRMFSFFNAYDEPERVFDYLRQTVELGRSRGILMCHENEKKIYGDVLSRNFELLDRVEGLQYVYDPANFLQVGEKAEDTLKALRDRACYFHIKDVISATEELVPAGCGDGHIAELVSGIREDKVLSVEPHLAVFKGYAEIDGTALKNKYRFASKEEAFDTAVRALKDILRRAGYTEQEGAFVK